MERGSVFCVGCLTMWLHARPPIQWSGSPGKAVSESLRALQGWLPMASFLATSHASQAAFHHVAFCHIGFLVAKTWQCLHAS